MDAATPLSTASPSAPPVWSQHQWLLRYGRLRVLMDHTLQRWGSRSFKWHWRAIALATAGCASPVPASEPSRVEGSSCCCPTACHCFSSCFLYWPPCTPRSSPCQGWKEGPLTTHVGCSVSPEASQMHAGSTSWRSYSTALLTSPQSPRFWCLSLWQGHVAPRAHSGCFECKVAIAARAAENNICTAKRQTVVLINR